MKKSVDRHAYPERDRDRDRQRQGQKQKNYIERTNGTNRERKQGKACRRSGALRNVESPDAKTQTDDVNVTVTQFRSLALLSLSFSLDLSLSLSAPRFGPNLSSFSHVYTTFFSWCL